MSDNVTGKGLPAGGAEGEAAGGVGGAVNDVEGGTSAGVKIVVNGVEGGASEGVEGAVNGDEGEVNGDAVEGAVGGDGASVAQAAKEEFFHPLDAEDTEVTVVQSFCVNCNGQGVTRLMLAKIPFFRDVIVSSFDCQHCGYENSEIDSANEISPIGVEYILNVKEKEDLDRLVVKSDYSAILIPELDLEIATKTQRGEVTTVEGILTRVANGLAQDQARRKDAHQEAYEQIEEYLKKIEDYRTLKYEFTLMLRDVSGNSYIANRPGTLDVAEDKNMRHKKFTRTRDDDRFLGIDNYPLLPEEIADESTGEPTEQTNFKDEVLQMETNCPNCGEFCDTKMKVTDIPNFKEVIIMATDCDKCGLRTNEVKSGGGIEALGKRIKLRVKCKEDLNRDVLKSDTCYVAIPELELLAGSGTIVGKFTTIEGLLLDIKKQLSDENPMIGTDSVDPAMKKKMDQFVADLDLFLTGEKEFTLILDDPAGNCYIQNLYAPDDDPELLTVDYERTFEQNEDLGLNDMKVDGEEEDGLKEGEEDDGLKEEEEEDGLKGGEKKEGLNGGEKKEGLKEGKKEEGLKGAEGGKGLKEDEKQEGLKGADEK